MSSPEFAQDDGQIMPNGRNRTCGILHWLWRRKDQNSPSMLVEPPKEALTKKRFTTISWHFWTISPCLVTVVLFWLNISNYSIGRELGPVPTTPDRTGIILGILQVCSKVHEIMMVIGLLNIAQQVIQRALTQGGLLLGLLGAEGSLGNVLFIFSKRFRVAFRYGFNGNGGSHQGKIRELVAVIFVVCSLCAVVGPASALLIVPRLLWFEEHSLPVLDPLGYYYYAPESGSPSLKPNVSRCYPYIMIDPALGNAGVTGSQYFQDSPLFAPYPEYWRAVRERERVDQQEGSSEYSQLLHQFEVFSVPVTINSTSPKHRTLYGKRRDWIGGTNFSSVNMWDSSAILYSLDAYQPKGHAGSPRRFTAKLTGIQSETVCRARAKVQCKPSNFCFGSVSPLNNDSDHIMDSADLLLIYDSKNNLSNPKPPGQDNESLPGYGYFFDSQVPPLEYLTKIWITEGPLEPHSASLNATFVTVLELNLSSLSSDGLYLDMPGTNITDELIICATSAALGTVEATSSRARFDPEQIQFQSGGLEYFDYAEKDGPVSSMGNRILYHRSWLDRIHTFNASYDMVLGDIQPATRNMNILTVNPGLLAWGTEISRISTGAQVNKHDPSFYELSIGGHIISLLSRIPPSNTQYLSATTGEYVRVTAKNFTDIESSSGFLPMRYPADLLLEKPISCKDHSKTLYILYYSYGYQWRSTSRILSMVVLILHCLVAIVGSLWQWYRGSLVNGWQTVAEYATLALGTDPEKAPLPSTCAGIKSKGTLGTLVAIREASGLSGEGKHLELKVLAEEDLQKEDTVKVGQAYGIQNITKTANVEITARPTSSSIQATAIPG